MRGFYTSTLRRYLPRDLPEAQFPLSPSDPVFLAAVEEAVRDMPNPLDYDLAQGPLPSTFVRPCRLLQLSTGKFLDEDRDVAVGRKRQLYLALLRKHMELYHSGVRDSVLVSKCGSNDS